MNIEGNIVDIKAVSVYPGRVTVKNGLIEKIESLEGKNFDHFILPGFIDSHVHIESSMLIPSEFARLAVAHGTVATVSDPHEIANVCGMEGVEYMISNGKTVPFKFNFGAPSCVPATSFETAGAVLDVKDVRKLLEKPEIKYLSEMMNFPGVLNGDPEVLQKINAAQDLGKPVDGHAPGLRGEEARKYISAGISTDHECFTAAEALDKLKLGMKILIREGSAAKNFEALIGLLHEYPDQMMFCSDDKHPDSLEAGHINQLCSRAVEKGIDVFKILKAACLNPVQHYKLDVGLLKEGDPADFILVKDLGNFEVLQTYINGQLVAENGKTLIQSQAPGVVNNFNCTLKTVEAFAVKANEATRLRVIEALDGQLITHQLSATPKLEGEYIVSDTENDILKIAVINRYYDAPVATAFIKNFGLKKGALASSVAHDSHNIVVVGVDDESICKAVNQVIEQKGGVSAVNEAKEAVLPLPVAGLMSAGDGYAIARSYTAIDSMAKEMGSRLSAPFMTLSFMALLVIPALKLSDKGLFDGTKFEFVEVTEN
ncbi:adenine deaminase [Niabella yanshanensis]|uniref:Adenine deaminase n=1 Tax=Niabella yanshanensis TaxID=577386 RepID=A0ABZ0W3W1_9BACT|nr:adenine deaminase [Niabella yanshanensis]WQD37318.1 adenine deaminase [Niabella yanshanensis]